MANDVIIAQPSYQVAQLCFDDKTKTHIRKTLAQSATDDEFTTFILMCESYQLNPINKEIFFVKYGHGKATIITSRDGYLKIANLHPMFNGIESDSVYEGDILTKRADGSILITYGTEHMTFDKSKLRGAFCNVFRKDRDVTMSTYVSLKEYFKKEAPIWTQYTHAMIIKVAEAMALKRAFAISGLVSQEEMGAGNLEEDK